MPRNIRGDGQTGLILLALDDISSRKRVAEQKYRRLFETAKDGILIVDDKTGEVTDANPCMIDLFGYSREEVVGKAFGDVPPLTQMKDYRQALDRVRREEVVRLPDVTLRTKDGTPVDAEVVANTYHVGENRIIQFNIRDVTERKRFEEQLQQTAKLESLGLLAGGIAHDFNNLLTGIIGNASMALADAPPGSSYQSALKDVIQAGQRAADLTREMLAYAGKGRFLVRPMNLSELVREIGRLMRSSIPRFIELELHLADNLPLIEADASQMQQLIMNLVINGAEASQDAKRGLVQITTSQQELDARTIRRNFSGDQLRPGPYVVLQVKDFGSGMDEKTRSRIFDPFFTTKFTGRGLGLAAALGIVRGHGGAIRVSSAPGRGSAFEVVLPVTQAPPVSAPPAKMEESKPAEEPRGNGLVLVVDDEELVLRMAKIALERRGYETLTATNGEEAVQIVRNRGPELSLVILDLTMPVMGGEEALAQIKAIRPDLQVILSSGYDESEAMKPFTMTELVGFIQKPYTVQKLVGTVTASLKK